MDKQQLFLANNIFDIDSALDTLEENLFTSSDEKSEITTSQQQNCDIAKQHKGEQEENGNASLSDDGASESLNDNRSEKARVNRGVSKIFFLDTFDYKTEDVDDSLTNDTAGDDQMRSEIFDQGTRTFSATTYSAKFSDSSDSSSDSDVTSNSSDEGQDNQRNSEVLSQVTTTIDHDDSSKRLISDESSTNQQFENFDNADDQPVTNDLTLTKTVELTENEPDPEPEVEVPKPEPQQENIKVVKLVIPQPIEVETMKPLEEPNEEILKEMSLNNFESTMDDISDAELESLEQELEDLVASVELNIEKASPTDIVLKTPTEDSNEIKTEVIEELVTTPCEPERSSAIEQVVVAGTAESVEKAGQEKITAKQTEVEVETGEKTLEIETPAITTEQEDLSEIQEISVVSETERESSVSEAQEAFEPSEQPATTPDADPAISTSSTDESTSIQNLPSQATEDFSINESNSTGSLTSAPDLGRVPPYWVPDEMTNQCMQCDTKFSLIKRRHHCRACGLLLCSNCCNQKFILHYLGTEGRICGSCLETLQRAQQNQQNLPRNPNPANPMEYCSTLPPQQQVNAGAIQPPTVMVPTGVLKRGPRTTERKSVIFSDGIRPGTDLEEATPSSSPRAKPKLNLPPLNAKTNSFIPETANELPPVLLKEREFAFVNNDLALLQRLRQEELKFAINKNFYVTVKIVTCETPFT